MKVMVDWCFGAGWFRIRIGIPQSNNPFHKGISGIQTTGPQTNNEPLVDSTFWKKQVDKSMMLFVVATLPETNSKFTPENLWLGDDPFLLRGPIFRVSLREGTLSSKS